MPFALIIGIYFSYKLKFNHIIKLHKVFSFLKKSDGNNNKNISSFAALSTILGGNLGTGNISGVAVALSTGGPGSLLWMCIIIFAISSIKYVSCLFGIQYRVKSQNGIYSGGPMYYLEKACSSKILSYTFAFALIISAITVGNLVQVNSLTLPITNSGFPPIIFGIAITIIILLVTIGGLRSFTETITITVPFMAVLYLLACTYILITNYSAIPGAFLIIFKSAFGIHNISAGVLGYSFPQVISSLNVGFARGIFATDIGLGLEAVIHSNVQIQPTNKEFAKEQSIISVLSPFVVMVVCIITGLVLIVTGVWNNPTLESTNMCFVAFNNGIPYSSFPGYIILIVLFCFAFTTILTWMFCANKAVEYLSPNNKKTMILWKAFFIALLPFGTIINSTLLWKMADFTIALMLALNLYGVLKLSHKVSFT